MARTRPSAGGLALALVAALAIGPGASSAEEIQVSAELQARLLVKVLSFDRSLPARAGKDVTLGVLVQRHHRASLDAAEEMVAAVEALPPPSASEPRLHAVLVDATLAGLERQLETLRIEALYLTRLRAVAVGEVVKTTRPRGVRTLTGVPGYVREGVCVGIGVRDERPEILVNLLAAQAEGADFSAQLLDLARVVR